MLLVRRFLFFTNAIAASVCFLQFAIPLFSPFSFFFSERLILSLSFFFCANAFELVQTQLPTADMGAAGVILLILFIIVAIVGVLAFLGWFARRQ